MAEEPAIGGHEPIVVDVVAGESYWWCRCGRSNSQPFCDGSHQGTVFEPMEWKATWKATRNRPMQFCTCKQTKSPPFCDDSHEDL